MAGKVCARALNARAARQRLPSVSRADEGSDDVDVCRGRAALEDRLDIVADDCVFENLLVIHEQTGVTFELTFAISRSEKESSGGFDWPHTSGTTTRTTDPITCSCPVGLGELPR